MSLWELLVVAIVALIVIKPERLPEIAYALGKITSRLKKIIQNFHNMLQQFNSHP